MTIDIISLCKYCPTKIYGQKNPAFNNSRESKLLLDLKDSAHPNHKTAIRYFAGKLSSYLTKVKFNKSSVTTAAVVPSSRAGLYSKGLEAILNLIKDDFNLDVQAGILMRHTNISPLHGGGPRDLGIHFASITLQKNLVVPGRPILLLDDITTTGGSLDACSILLKKNGASDVLPIALGKTTYEQ